MGPNVWVDGEMSVEEKESEWVDDRSIPDPIKRAVEMLNNPRRYADVFKNSYDYSKKRGYLNPRTDPAKRIRAKAEWLPFKEKWALYVEWDDSSPLTARSIVHKAIRECGLTVYVASGRGYNYDGDADDDKKFRKGAEVSWLKVMPHGHRVIYKCSSCGDRGRKPEGTVDLSFSVE